MIYLYPSHTHNFPQNHTLQRRRVNSIRHSTESISLLRPKIWDLVPNDIKLLQSLSIQKKKKKEKMGAFAMSMSAL